MRDSTTDHTEHEMIRATARAAHVGEIALAVCLTCKQVLNVWPIGTAPIEGDQ